MFPLSGFGQIIRSARVQRLESDGVDHLRELRHLHTNSHVNVYCSDSQRMESLTFWRGGEERPCALPSSISSSWPGSHSCAYTKPHTQRHLSKCQRRFSCRKKCARSDGNEGVRVIAFPQGQQWVDWVEMRGLCHPGPFPEQRDRKWPGILGGHKPSSVCLYQTTIRYFIQMASKHRPLWRRAWRDMSERFTSASLFFFF